VNPPAPPGPSRADDVTRHACARIDGKDDGAMGMTPTTDPRLKQRLAAILAADAAGYSRLMAADDLATLAELDAARAIFRAKIAAHQGRVIDVAGDSVLAIFETAAGAVQAALDVQAALAEGPTEVADGRRLRFRIGVHMGDVIEKSDGTIYGDGVNIAARLQALAEIGGVAVSEAVRSAVKNRVSGAFEDRGAQTFKNIDESVRVFSLRQASTAPADPGRRPAPTEPPLPDKPSIAVLPFDNMSNDPDQAFFADGIVESITAALSRIRSFFVIARNSAFLYKGKAIDIVRVGRELGVRYVLEGSVQRAANRLRITVQLIETGSGTHVWADRFDGTLDDVFDLQDNITERVAGALQPSIRQLEVARALRKRPQELGAYDYTMRALPHAWALERESSTKAIELLQAALALDPNYPLALALAGWCYAQQAVYNWIDDADASRGMALRHAERAAETGGDDPLVLAVLGTVHSFVRNQGTARLLLERAVALDPNAAWAWSRLGWVEVYTDHPERALERFERAVRLSPLDPMNFNNVAGSGCAYEIMDRFDEAVDCYRRALQEKPHATWILRVLVSALVGAGRMDEARSALGQLLHAYPGYTISRFCRAHVFSTPTLTRFAERFTKIGLPE